MSLDRNNTKKKDNSCYGSIKQGLTLWKADNGNAHRYLTIRFVGFL